MASMAMLVITRSGIYGFFSTINHRIQSLMFGNGDGEAERGHHPVGPNLNIFSPFLASSRLSFLYLNFTSALIQLFFALFHATSPCLLHSTSLCFTRLHLFYSTLLSSSLVYPILLYAALYCSTLSYYSTLHYSALLSFPLI